jgi:hypothetical protein
MQLRPITQDAVGVQMPLLILLLCCFVPAVVLPGWYPSWMETENGTYILETQKCPQKYWW